MAKSLYRTETGVLVALLREFRAKAGLTQAQCSEALGRPQSFMSDVERGIRRLDLVQLRDLCQVLDVSLSVLIRQFENRLEVQDAPRAQK